MVVVTDSDSKSNPRSDSTTGSVSQAIEPPLPAYQSSTQGPSLSFSAPVLPEMPFIHPAIQFKPREPAWKRFLKAFIVAVGIYFLLGMIGRSLIYFVNPYIDERVPDGPYRSDGNVIRCTNYTTGLEVTEQQPLASFPPFSPPYDFKTSFSIPVSSNHIFFLSRGSLDQGSSIKLELSDNTGENMEVEVIMSYHNNVARGYTKVCLLERDEGGIGVGFFTPARFFPFPNPTDKIKFATTIRLPKSGTPNNPLVINALETKMGIWTHRITDLQNLVVFKSLSFHASNAWMRAESVSAMSAVLETSNSPISGSYNVSDSLSLTTSNSPITAKVILENDDGDNPTWLGMKTSNGRIQAHITTVSTDKSSMFPATFVVHAKTSNSPLDVAFLDAPVSPFSHLTFDGKTSNSPANVKLHPTYEGSIYLKTSSVFMASLKQDPTTQDPSGKGRRRRVDVRKVIRGHLEAEVWWGDDSDKDEGKGKVTVETSNSNNIVDLN